MILFKKHGLIISNEPCLLILDNKLYNFEDIDGKKLLPFFNKTHISIPASFEKKWFEAFAVNAIKKYEVQAKGFNITEKNANITACLKLEKDWNNKYVFILLFSYDEKSFLWSNTEKLVLNFNIENLEFTKYTRNFDWENTVVNQLKSIGLKQNSENNFEIEIKSTNTNQQLETIEWLNNNSAKIDALNIELKQLLGAKIYFTEKISIKVHVSGDKDWFDIRGMVKFGDFKIPFIKLRKNLIEGNKEFLLPDGTYAIIPDEWFSKYSQLMVFGKENNEILELGKSHFTLLDDNSIEGINTKKYDGLVNINSNVSSQIEVPADIRAELRPYQKEGLNWLYELQKNDFGACLADDMGLGKTLQTISLIQKTIDERKKESSLNNLDNENNTEYVQQSLFSNNDKKLYKKKPSLVIMPVSLIHNWENEIMKFSPFLKVLKYRGNKRDEKFKKFDNYDVILTGYGVARNDIELLSEYEFLYVILDESQFIKNPDSKIYKAILKLNSLHKLVLTGTPIENSLRDLWSQMNFINTGMLGNYNFFKENFRTPIEKNNDIDTIDKLKKLISPFILRRTKDQVAKDLPALTEQIIYADMCKQQKDVYETEKSKIRNLILENITSDDKKNTSFFIIQALTKLRQIANHPLMFNPDYDGSSGKFEDIIRNVENIIAENHKVLIFSSFVKHLNIFENHFNENDIEYSILTGQTVNREEVISEFQNNKKNKIFLISIKAGGTGLNLTQADYVFILDPWWNPAVEKQAISRAHRIGQDKKVMVYKYISRDTIEEKIRILQHKKNKLSDSFIDTNNPFSNFSPENILELFK